MHDRTGTGWILACLAAASLGFAASASSARAETVMQQCGQQYQAAKAANTLNGQTWNQFRTECAARLKTGAATPAVPPATPAPTPATVPAANPLKPAPAVVKAPPPPAPASVPAAAPVAPAPASTAPATTTATGKPISPGRVAFQARERQCGSEWRTNKVTLVAQTPGLTWPKNLSQCNTRLKAAGQ